MATRVSASGSRTGGTSTSRTTSAPKKTPNYNYDPRKESASQYNARIASERGDSSSSLAKMQKTTSDVFKSKGLDANKVNTPSIAADRVTPVPPLTLPKPVVTDPGNLLGQMGAALAPSLSDVGTTYDAKTGMFTTAPVAEATPQSNLQDYLNNLTALQANQPSGEGILAQLEKDNRLKQKQQAVNTYTGQLNAIQAKSQADQLRLEGQGRGITDTIIGGQQAQINREAAIAALPVAAQLSAAQGDLQMAREHIDKMFGIKMQDAQNKYAFQTKVADTLFQYANAEQARKMEEKQRADDRAFATFNSDQQYARQLAMQAVEFGQTGLAGKLGALDLNTPEGKAQLGVLAGQLSKPVAKTTASAPDVKNFGTADNPDWRSYNFSTGQWEAASGVGGPGGAGTPETQKTIDQLSFLRTTAGQARDLANSEGIINSPIGPSAINRTIGAALVGNTSFQQLNNKSDTLKTNVLAIMTDPNVRKFFGPQMSNTDVQLIQSIGTTLNPLTQSKEDYVKEVQRIDDLLNRAQTAVTIGMANQGGTGGQSTMSQNIITSPDGLQIEIID